MKDILKTYERHGDMQATLKKESSSTITTLINMINIQLHVIL